MPEEGQLTIRKKKCCGPAELLVVDNSCGIRPDAMKRLFQPFFITKGNGGNGLGLSLSKRTVDEHDRKLPVRSSVRPGRTGYPLASQAERYRELNKMARVLSL